MPFEAQDQPALPGLGLATFGSGPLRTSPDARSTTVPLTLQVRNLILREVTDGFSFPPGESLAKDGAPRCVPISYRPTASCYLTLM
jgi:hypothetical protein